MTIKSPKLIQYVSAPAGSGKTHQLQILAEQEVNQFNKKIIIAQPTKRLMGQTATAIRAINPNTPVHVIVNQKNVRAAVPAIEAHMRNADPSKGQVLIISHEALKRLPNAYRAHWDLYVDEIPEVFQTVQLNVVKTHHHISSFLDIEAIDSNISSVKIKAGHYTDIESLNLNRSEDELISHFSEITDFIMSDNYDVMVETQNYQSLVNGEKTKGEVNFFALLGTAFIDSYNSVTFMGANAEQTSLFLLWNKLKLATFVKQDIITKGLRYRIHENGSRLTINYLFENELSKTRLESVNPQTGLTLLEGVEQYVSKFFSGSRFLWVANKNAIIDSFDQNDKLPPVAHGLNKSHWMAANAVVSMIALMYSKPAAHFLGLIGLSEAEIRTIICYQAEYQAMMRCSLRVPDAIAPVTLIVPSRASAEWIANCFPSCSVAKLETGLDWTPSKGGRPVKSVRKTNAERQAAFRARKKAAQEVL
jgi:hypothetical protein